MDDIIGKTTSAYKLSDFRMGRMVLAPEHWRKYRIPSRLKWRGVKFARNNKARVPVGVRGVYTFVVKPGVAQHPSCAYLLYVGKAEKQVLRDRFSQYFTEMGKGDSSRRPHVTEMLRKWDGHLWFYYAEIRPKQYIRKVEDALLVAYLPPTNRTYPSSVRHAVAKLFAQ